MKRVLTALPVAAVVAAAALAAGNRTAAESPEVETAAGPVQKCSGHVALTFDDGPTPLTGQLLDALQAAQVPATFFNLGSQEQQFPGHVEREDAQAHQFGNHTWSHRDLTKLSPRKVRKELRRASDFHASLVDEPYRLFRPPYGATSPAIRAEAKRQGMVEALWTVDSKDYEATSPAQVVERSKGMRDGGILLLHDGKQHTIDALPQIVAHYRAQGLCFGKIAKTGTAQLSDWGVPFNARAVAVK